MYQNDLMAIADFLTYISETYNLQISITEVYQKKGEKISSSFRILHRNKYVRTILQPFNIHYNNYCMYLKSNQELLNRCISHKGCIFRRFKNDTSVLYGMCYAGIEEYIVPVIYNGNLIALLHAGSFCSDENKAKIRISKVAKRYKFDEELMMKNYLESVKKDIPDRKVITALLSAAAICIASTFSYIKTKENDIEYYNQLSYKENYILMHIIEYVKQNFKSNITINDISSFCHCSKSTVSHIFSKYMNQKLSDYINMLRVDEAKNYLANTDLSMQLISDQVGFNDSNYFTKVFGKITGLTPKEYRRKYKM